MATYSPPEVPFRWELAAETIAVEIRWFGLIVGYVLVNVGVSSSGHRPILNGILTLGLLYTLLDTYFRLQGRVFLDRFPLVISLMEAVFIGLLCFSHQGLDSPFRFYYFLSLICGAIRYSTPVTFLTWLFHGASYGLLFLALPFDQQNLLTLLLTLVVLGWVAWACDALSRLLKNVGAHLGHLNAALRENQALLEARIAERGQQLQETQAHLLHQEKMAAFGLLAAGIAHEVGNPLTSISSLVQILQRRPCDAFTADKLTLVSGQLQRIQTTLRELINFSRPASNEPARVSVGDILAEAQNIAKYYQGTKNRNVERDCPEGLPTVLAIRDQLVQVLLNLILNAVDATDKNGLIELRARQEGEWVEILVRDNGAGIPLEQQARVFQPYFTTKKNGTGLGLFVSRKIIADHGGTLGFQSGPDRGTAFCVRLPLQTTEPVVSRTPGAVTSPFAGRTMTS